MKTIVKHLLLLCIGSGTLSSCAGAEVAEVGLFTGSPPPREGEKKFDSISNDDNSAEADRYFLLGECILVAEEVFAANHSSKEATKPNEEIQNLMVALFRLQGKWAPSPKKRPVWANAFAEDLLAFERGAKSLFVNPSPIDDFLFNRFTLTFAKQDARIESTQHFKDYKALKSAYLEGPFVQNRSPQPLHQLQYFSIASQVPPGKVLQALEKQRVQLTSDLENSGTLQIEAPADDDEKSASTDQPLQSRDGKPIQWERNTESGLLTLKFPEEVKETTQKKGWWSSWGSIPSFPLLGSTTPQPASEEEKETNLKPGLVKKGTTQTQLTLSERELAYLLLVKNYENQGHLKLLLAHLKDVLEAPPNKNKELKEYSKKVIAFYQLQNKQTPVSMQRVIRRYSYLLAPNFVEGKMTLTIAVGTKSRKVPTFTFTFTNKGEKTASDNVTITSDNDLQKALFPLCGFDDPFYTNYQKKRNINTASYRIAIFCLKNHMLRANFNGRLERYQKEAQKQEDFLKRRGWLKVTYKKTEIGYNLKGTFLNKKQEKEGDLFLSYADLERYLGEQPDRASCTIKKEEKKNEEEKNEMEIKYTPDKLAGYSPLYKILNEQKKETDPDDKKETNVIEGEEEENKYNELCVLPIKALSHKKSQRSSLTELFRQFKNSTSRRVTITAAKVPYFRGNMELNLKKRVIPYLKWHLYKGIIPPIIGAAIDLPPPLKEPHKEQIDQLLNNYPMLLALLQGHIHIQITIEQLHIIQDSSDESHLIVSKEDLLGNDKIEIFGERQKKSTPIIETDQMSIQMQATNLKNTQNLTLPIFAYYLNALEKKTAKQWSEQKGKQQALVMLLYHFEALCKYISIRKPGGIYRFRGRTLSEKLWQVQGKKTPKDTDGKVLKVFLGQIEKFNNSQNKDTLPSSLVIKGPTDTNPCFTLNFWEKPKDNPISDFTEYLFTAHSTIATYQDLCSFQNFYTSWEKKDKDTLDYRIAFFTTPYQNRKAFDSFRQKLQNYLFTEQPTTFCQKNNTALRKLWFDQNASEKFKKGARYLVIYQSLSDSYKENGFAIGIKEGEKTIFLPPPGEAQEANTIALKFKDLTPPHKNKEDEKKEEEEEKYQTEDLSKKFESLSEKRREDALEKQHKIIKEDERNNFCFLLGELLALARDPKGNPRINRSAQEKFQRLFQLQGESYTSESESVFKRDLKAFISPTEEGRPTLIIKRVPAIAANGSMTKFTLAFEYASDNQQKEQPVPITGLASKLLKKRSQADPSNTVRFTTYQELLSFDRYTNATKDYEAQLSNNPIALRLHIFCITNQVSTDLCNEFINGIYGTWKGIFDGRKVAQDYSEKIRKMYKTTTYAEMVKFIRGGNPLFVIEKAPYHPDEDSNIRFKLKRFKLKISPADTSLGKDKTRLDLTFEEWWSQLTLTEEIGKTKEQLKKTFLQELDKKARQTTKEHFLRDIVQSLIATFQNPTRKPEHADKRGMKEGLTQIFTSKTLTEELLLNGTKCFRIDDNANPSAQLFTSPPKWTLTFVNSTNKNDEDFTIEDLWRDYSNPIDNLEAFKTNVTAFGKWQTLLKAFTIAFIINILIATIFGPMMILKKTTDLLIRLFFASFAPPHGLLVNPLGWLLPFLVAQSFLITRGQQLPSLPPRGQVILKVTSWLLLHYILLTLCTLLIKSCYKAMGYRGEHLYLYPYSLIAPLLYILIASIPFLDPTSDKIIALIKKVETFPIAWLTNNTAAVAPTGIGRPETALFIAAILIIIWAEQYTYTPPEKSTSTSVFLFRCAFATGAWVTSLAVVITTIILRTSFDPLYGYLSAYITLTSSRWTTLLLFASLWLLTRNYIYITYKLGFITYILGGLFYIAIGTIDLLAKTERFSLLQKEHLITLLEASHLLLLLFLFISPYIGNVRRERSSLPKALNRSTAGESQGSASSSPPDDTGDFFTITKEPTAIPASEKHTTPLTFSPLSLLMYAILMLLLLLLLLFFLRNKKSREETWFRLQYFWGNR